MRRAGWVKGLESWHAGIAVLACAHRTAVYRSLSPSCLCSAEQGTVHTARAVVRADGLLGLYAGFETVIMGLVPARMVRSW